MFDWCGAKSHDPSFLKSLLIGLFVVFVLLIIAVVLLIICYYAVREHPPPVCTSNECVRIAAKIHLAMDESKDPCKDFYEFTCAHWESEKENTRWAPLYSSLEEIKDRVLTAAQQVLSNSSETASKAVEKARILYQSCMDTDTLDAQGVGEVVKYITSTGLHNRPAYLRLPPGGSHQQYQFNWMRMEARVKKLFDVDIFMGLQFRRNLERVQEKPVWIYRMAFRYPEARLAPLPTLEDQLAPDSESNFQLDKELQLKFIQAAIKIIGGGSRPGVFSNAAIEIAANRIIKIKNSIEKIKSKYTHPFTEPRCPSVWQYDKALKEKLEKKVGKINDAHIWTTFLERMTEDLDRPKIIPKKDLVCLSVEMDKVIVELLTFIYKTSKVDQELYLWWVTANALIMNAGPNVTKSLYQIVLNSESSVRLRSRSDQCTKTVIKFMGRAVAYALAEQHVDSKKAEMIKRFIVHMDNEIFKTLIYTDFMDAKTRNMFMDKLTTIWRLTRTQWLWNAKRLDRLYSKIEVKNDTYLANMVAFTENFYPTAFQQLFVLEDKSELWGYLSLNDDSIYIIMAAVLYPLYDAKLEPITYGTLGFLLGREVFRKFMKPVIIYASERDYHVWWTSKTLKEWIERGKCFKEEYDKMSITQIKRKVDGQKTLRDNMIDHAALRVSLDAYEHYMSRHHKHEEDMELLGLGNFTDYQLFFLAFANIMCEKQTTKSLQEVSAISEKPPNQIRVLGTLQNFEEFHDAFGCTEPSKMCNLWV